MNSTKLLGQPPEQVKCPFHASGTTRPLAESILISRPTKADGFNRLITNPETEPFDGRKIVSRSTFFGGAIIRVMEYLTKLKNGNGNNAHCPFVGGIERRNGYYLAMYDPMYFISATPHDFLLNVIDNLMRAFSVLSPGLTKANRL